MGLPARTQRVLAFGSVMLASSMMHNVFATYYLEMYLSAGITPGWFYLGQVIFMVWNAVNDPLFGWLSDNYLPATLQSSAMGRRTAAIKFGGPLWALAFVIVWFPPAAGASAAATGLHFAACLCFYDGMLSYVEVNHNALLAEMTASEEERAKALSVSAAFAGAGSLTSYAAQALWAPTGSMFGFRVLCVILGAASFVVFEISAYSLQRIHAGAITVTASPRLDDSYASGSESDVSVGARTPQRPRKRSKRAPGSDADEPDTPVTFLVFTKQLFKRRNFLVFVLLSFLQQFDCTYEKTFMSYTIASAADAVSTHMRSTVISLSFAAPHLVTIFMFPVLKKYGVHAVVSMLLMGRLGLLAVAWMSSHSAGAVVCTFVLCNRVASEALCRLFPMISSDLVDEDRYYHVRKRTLSASLVSFGFFFSKFSQSLAPIFGYALLPSDAKSSLTPHDTDRGSAYAAAAAAGRPMGAPSDHYGHGASAVNLLLCVATACVVAQMFLWSQYTLKGAHLKRIKRHARGRDDEERRADAEGV